jgi:hypothetical protein
MRAPTLFRKPDVFIDDHGTLIVSHAGYAKLKRLQIPRGRFTVSNIPLSYLEDFPPARFSPGEGPARPEDGGGVSLCRS